MFKLAPVDEIHKVGEQINFTILNENIVFFPVL